MTKINNDILEKWELENEIEVRAVKHLGESIGYGNMMSIASALWALKLKESGCPTTGAFIPTLAYDMKKKEGLKAVEEQNRRMEYFKKRFK